MKLTAIELAKQYGKRFVVSGVNLELLPGEIVGLLGPNGAGKTTTFHMITGFLKPDRGHIFLDSKEITTMPVYQRARSGLGYLSQEPSVFRKLTVKQNILAILEMLGKSKKEQTDILDYLLTKLEITRLAAHKAYTLSGGERRRVELARALAAKPSFLLLDEPFTGIDPIVRTEIQEIIKGLKRDGLGVLITDHNVRETLEITDRAYLMYDAKILIAGSAAKLIEDPDARKLYLGEKFRI
jgi:lipopolysaccharide export system ATP-binding protein